MHVFASGVEWVVKGALAVAKSQSRTEMAAIEPALVVDSRYHGKGGILYAWNPQCTHVATTGRSRLVHVFDKFGHIEEQVVPPSAR